MATSLSQAAYSLVHYHLELSATISLNARGSKSGGSIPCATKEYEKAMNAFVREAKAFIESACASPFNYDFEREEFISVLVEQSRDEFYCVTFEKEALISGEKPCITISLVSDLGSITGLQEKADEAEELRNLLEKFIG